MTALQAAGLWFALNMVLWFVLTLRVILYRRKNLISLKDNDDFVLIQRIRTQANFVETASFALIGLVLLAALNANTTLIHVLGGLLLLGRILHAHGMSQPRAFGPTRPIGMMTTFIVLAVEIIGLLYFAFA